MPNSPHPSELNALLGQSVAEVETKPYLELFFGRLRNGKDYTQADFGIEFHAGSHWELREMGGRPIETDETKLGRAVGQAQPGQNIVAGGLVFQIGAEGESDSNDTASLEPIVVDEESDHGTATRAALLGRVLSGFSFSGADGESTWSFDGSLVLKSLPNPLALPPGGLPAPAICISMAEGDREFRYRQDGGWTIY